MKTKEIEELGYDNRYCGYSLLISIDLQHQIHSQLKLNNTTIKNYDEEKISKRL